jgi:flagellar basal-body rod modification protein FlgD
MVPSIGATSPTTTTSTGQTKELGQDVFLNLLISQLKNQDPLEPMEGTEFVTQLAQFSELEEMQALTSGQAELQNYMASLNNFAAVSLLGKSVEFSGEQVTHQEGTTTEINFLLPSDAALVTVNLYDEQGNLVDTIEREALNGGSQTLVWDGKDGTEQPIPSGTYKCEVLAKDASDVSIPVQLMQRGVVQEVEFEEGVPSVRVGDRWLSLPDIRSIQTS